MTGYNEITGDALISKVSTKEYEEGWDRIFNKEKQNKNLIDGEQACLVLTTDKKEIIKDMVIVEK